MNMESLQIKFREIMDELNMVAEKRGDEAYQVKDLLAVADEIELRMEQFCDKFADDFEVCKAHDHPYWVGGWCMFCRRGEDGLKLAKNVLKKMQSGKTLSEAVAEEGANEDVVDNFMAQVQYQADYFVNPERSIPLMERVIEGFQSKE